MELVRENIQNLEFIEIKKPKSTDLGFCIFLTPLLFFNELNVSI